MKISEVKLLCEELGIRPSKQLGQNFLVDENVCNKIISKALNSKCKSMYEIGPGLGALTRGLRQGDKSFELIELDNKLASYWSDQGVKTYHQDAAKYDWSQKIMDKTIVVSNLPYQISSVIVINLSQVPLVEQMILMFQKEVAQRIMAKEGSKSYGLLSVLAQTYWSIDKLVDAGGGSFYPPPKIDSRVLNFERIDTDYDFGIKFTQFVKKAFSQRRKLLLKNLKPYTDNGSDLRAIFLNLGIGEKARAEELSVETFQKLFIEIENGN